MKNYKELLKSLPSKSVVFTIGRFNPPSGKNDLLVKIVKKLAVQRKSDHYIFVSQQCDKKNPLDVDKKLGYLNLFYRDTNFVKTDKTLQELLAQLSNKYKNIVVVSSEKLPEKLLKSGNIHHIPVPETDDADLIKLAQKGNFLDFKKKLPLSTREIDAKRLMNDVRIGLDLEPIKEQINLVKDDLREKYFRGEIFEEGSIVECDDTVYKIVKRGSNHLLLMNESGAKVSKWIQNVQLTEREFMLNEVVSDQSTVKFDAGAERERKMAELKAKQAKQKEDLEKRQAQETDSLKTNIQTAQNESKESPVVNTKSKYNIARSIMSLNDYRKMTGHLHGEEPGEHENNMDHHIQDKSSENIHSEIPLGGDTKEMGYTMAHQDYGHHHRRMKVKYKVHAEETDLQQGDRKAQLKRFKDQAADAKLEEAQYAGLEKEDKPGKKATEFKGTKNAVTGKTVEGWKDEQKPVAEGIKSMYHSYMAKRAGKKADHAFDMNDEEGFKKHVDDTEKHRVAAGGKPTKINTDPDKKSLTYREELEFPEIDDDQFMAEVQSDLDSLSEESFYEAYDDDELAIIDDETGEEIEAVAEELELDAPALMEVLSRVERIKAKARMRRTKAKRERAEKIALRRLSTPEVANRRARRLAISAMKKRLLKGQNPQKVSVGQKEAIERFIAQRKKVVDRLATRMVPRVKQIEKARLHHKKFTKPNNGVSF